MRYRLASLVVLSIMLLIGGCGGSGSTTLPPTTQDLTVLVGIWDYTITIQGNISGSGKTIPVNDNLTGYFVISQNSVEDDVGDNWSWSYNGSKLTLQYGDTYTDWDADCGNMYMTTLDTIKIPCNASTSVANLTGTGTGDVTTDSCGDLDIDLNYNGTITKR